jgi:periplasmic protein TonB
MRNGETIYRVGNGVAFPSCPYMPNPAFTDNARQAHVSGIILIDAVVETDGGLRIVRGLPGDWNEIALKTLATWRCKPARYEGKPVSAVVTFEVNFRRFDN